MAPGEETSFVHGVKMSRGFRRKLVVKVRSSGEDVEAAAKHALGVMVGHCTDLDTKVLVYGGL